MLACLLDHFKVIKVDLPWFSAASASARVRAVSDGLARELRGNCPGLWFWFQSLN